MAEVAVSIAVFMMMLVGLMELARIAYYATAIHYVAYESGKWSRLGRPLSSNRETVIQNRISQDGRKFGLDLQDENIGICIVRNSASDLTCPVDDDRAGAPGDTAIIKISQPVRILGSLQVTLTAHTAVRNESYY